MSSGRCSYRDEAGRCSRHGFGDPPLCRAHALFTITEEQEQPLPDWMRVGIDILDRQFSKSSSEVVRGFRDRLGDFLADAVEGSSRKQEPNQVPPPRQSRPRQPPPPPPPPPSKQEDPKEVLGFPVDSKPTKAQIKERQRELSKLFHPDRGGSLAAMQRVNAAAKELLSKL